MKTKIFYYKEYDKNNEEKIHISRGFKTTTDLINFMFERQKFYSGDMKRIVIEIITVEGDEK